MDPVGAKYKPNTRGFSAGDRDVVSATTKVADPDAKLCHNTPFAGRPGLVGPDLGFIV
jgi:hypothetical protein